MFPSCRVLYMYAHKKVTMGKINTINRLLRYLKGELSAEEACEVEKWADESKENERELVALAKVYHLGHLARNYSKQEVDQAWAKVSGRAGGTKKNSVKARPHRWVIWSMAAAILMLVCVNVHLMLNDGPAPVQDGYLTLTSVKGSHVVYTLPDSTIVTLNRNSTLEFPMAFNSAERRVRLTGEGFFEVAKDPSRPFIVETDKDINIRVLGTVFNLQSYASDDVVQVALIEGSVEVSKDNGSDFSYLMHPSEKFTCNTSTGEMSVENMVEVNGNEWMFGKIVFSDTPLKEVARQLTNHFDTKVTVADEKLSTIRFSGSFDNHRLEQVLSYMEQSCGIRAVKTRDMITLEKK